jgi:hypothetical protein
MQESRCQSTSISVWYRGFLALSLNHYFPLRSHPVTFNPKRLLACLGVTVLAVTLVAGGASASTHRHHHHHVAKTAAHTRHHHTQRIASAAAAMNTAG